MRFADVSRMRWWLVPLAVLVVDVVIALFVLPQTAVRDELFFYPAAKAFAAAGVFPSLDFLRHYDAPQTPLSLYLAGRLLAVVPNLRLLRLVDCLLMFSGLLRFSGFAARCCGKNAALATALVALNPYFHLAATHFYTDALYFWLVVRIVTRPPARSAWLSLSLLPLVRQFGIIFPLGEALHGLAQRRFRAAATALLTLVPFGALCVLWHGFAPDAPRAQIQTGVHRAYGWFFPYVATYHVAALGFYLAPIAWAIPRTRRFWVFGLAFALAYALAPAHPNFSAQLAGSGITTLGLVHRGALLLWPRAAQVALAALAFLGGGLIGEALADRSALRFFVALFIALSVLNFQAWDKYLLDVIPATLLAILASRSNARPLPA